MRPLRWSIGRAKVAQPPGAAPPASAAPAAARFYEGPVRWITPASAASAQSSPAPNLDGFTRVSWPELQATWIAPARATGMQRPSLQSAAQPWLDWLAQVDRLAITGVELDGPGAVADLLGFVVEPATRRGIELAIEARQEIADLDEAAFAEPEFGYPHSLQRLRWALRGTRPVRQAPARLKDSAFTPDPTQATAIEAGDGVVQVIAPAGSGKTAALVERVGELRRRGVPAATIACLTFNRAAKAQLSERLQAASLGSVDAFTFHGLAYRILADVGLLSPQTRIGEPTTAQWRRLAAIARSQGGDGVWIEPAEAAELLSQIKLGQLLSAEQYAAAVAERPDPHAQTMAALYAAHDQMQRAAGRIDFDDLVLQAVQLLRRDAKVRERWQGRYHQVLVDEYQDIEPAQELIVRIVAAPHDQLFCVGDEDQVLYAFRRASVERIICLDGPYPGLQRFAFATNYRCPARVVEASRALIAANRVRFAKQIEPDPTRADVGSVNLLPYIRPSEAAAEIATLLQGKQPGEVAVLARTSDALRPLALACAERGVTVAGRDKLFEQTGARLALQRHLLLALAPEQASAELVHEVCQTPARGLQRGGESAIAAQLREGQGFAAAFAAVPAPRRNPRALLAPGELFEALAACEDAAAAVSLLRGPGGFDQWFAEGDELGGPDQFESEVLAQAESEAAGSTPVAYLAELERQAAALKQIREPGAIELLTIHAAKGRQWPHLILLACEEGTLPHVRAGHLEPAAEARGEGIEAERRLAYVAFTRAQKRLDLHYDRARPSRFLTEAGVLARNTRAPRIPPELLGAHRPASLWSRFLTALFPGSR
jgi:DNA helicase II / ATP-dependent DNA helicase PcrA